MKLKPVSSLSRQRGGTRRASGTLCTLGSRDQSLALHLLFEDAERLLDIVVANENLHSDILLVKEKGRAIPTLRDHPSLYRIRRRYIRGRHTSRLSRRTASRLTRPAD